MHRHRAVIAPTIDFGTHTLTLTVADPGGAVASDDVVVTVADSFTNSPVTPPTSPAAYTFGQAVTASYSCSDSAGILASCVGTVANGAGIDTSSSGSHAFSVTATNTRGDTSSMAWTYTVVPATSTVTVTCPASQVYSGVGLTPCTAVATGAGGLNEALTVAYTGNTNAGTATASASFAGDANHDAATARRRSPSRRRPR